MKVSEMQIPDVLLIEPEIYTDDRGYFLETFRNTWFEEMNLDVHFVQDNQSYSKHGVLRGLHYQIRQPQGKLVKVTRGKVYDVVVDMRKSSDTFGQYVGVILSEEKKNLIWVPPGFAHGFYVMSDGAEITYKCSNYYSPEFERTLFWKDPDINIDWPLGKQKQPILSDKDLAGVRFTEAEYFG